MRSSSVECEFCKYWRKGLVRHGQRVCISPHSRFYGHHTTRSEGCSGGKLVDERVVHPVAPLPLTDSSDPMACEYWTCTNPDCTFCGSVLVPDGLRKPGSIACPRCTEAMREANPCYHPLSATDAPEVQPEAKQ